jgi:hypothetical protein
MKWVDILKRDAATDAFPTVARALLPDDAASVTFEGDPSAYEDLVEQGAEADGSVLFPKDGARFLAALPAFMDNPTGLLASTVQEGDAPPPLA